MSYHHRSGGNAIGSLFFLLTVGAFWISVLCWKNMRRRTNSVVLPTLVLLMAWLAVYGFVATPGRTNQKVVAAAALRIERSDLPCIVTARGYQGIIDSRHRAAGRDTPGMDDQVAWLAQKIAYTALNKNIDAASVDCGAALDRIRAIAGAAR